MSPDPIVLMFTKKIKRIVIKVGTGVVLTDNNQFARPGLIALIQDICDYHSKGYEILLVSSGAIGMGLQVLGLAEKPKELTKKQACAAAGQTALISAYQNQFYPFQKKVAQVLLTSHDFSDPKTYLNLKQAMTELINFKTIPIINENDVVSTQEIEGEGKVFGDNDTLSAIIASKLDADLLILLSDIDGVYTQDPKTNSSAMRVSCITHESQLSSIQFGHVSASGRGGISTKIQACLLASRSGVHSIIANGHKQHVLKIIMEHPEAEGTHFILTR